MCIHDLLELILFKLSDKTEILEELSMFLENPKLITFFVINKNSNGMEEKIRLFDPLYSNNYIRNVDPKTPIDILFKLGAPEEVSRMDHRVIVKKSGYSKFKITNSHYEWRECKIKEDNNVFAKFKSFNNHCKN
jgi:hypothetical protein